MSGEDLPQLDSRHAHPARVYNYWLGGKDNFAADREAAERVLEIMPSIPFIARAVRLFLVDAVHRLAAEHGVSQFLDIGTGLPTADNTHDVAQRVEPRSRIVYVDYDPVVLTHAQALLTSSPGGETDYVQADLRDTATILAEAARTLDLTRPVAILLIAILNFIPDAEDPYAIVNRLMDAVPSGSYLFVTHFCASSKEARDAEKQYLALLGTGRFRTVEEITAYFGGHELLEPGVVPLPLWRPDGPVAAEEELTVGQKLMYGGIARKL
jgi:O-methyltransferase involved in polyketide biosynthesis